MSATRTGGDLGLAGGGVQMVAADAMKRGLPPGMLEKRVIPSIVVHPEADKQACRSKTVENSGGDQIHYDEEIPCPPPPIGKLIPRLGEASPPSRAWRNNFMR